MDYVSQLREESLLVRVNGTLLDTSATSTDVDQLTPPIECATSADVVHLFCFKYCIPDLLTIYFPPAGHAAKARKSGTEQE